MSVSVQDDGGTKTIHANRMYQNTGSTLSRPAPKQRRREARTPTDWPPLMNYLTA